MQEWSAGEHDVEEEEELDTAVQQRALVVMVSGVVCAAEIRQRRAVFL